MGVSGTLAVIGSPNKRRSGIPYGGAYAYREGSQGWQQEASLIPVGINAGTWYGDQVAVDGDTVAVSAPQATNGSGIYTGAVYVWTRTQTGWGVPVKITPDNGQPRRLFGESLALKSDTLLVGSEQRGGSSGEGSAYVYERYGGTWQQTAILYPSSRPVGSSVARSLALDGNIAYISENLVGDGTAGLGSVIPFMKIAGTWVEQPRLETGSAFTLAADSGRLLVTHFDDGDYSRGSVLIYRKTSESWAYQAIMRPSDPHPEQVFGASLALRGDVAIVGAPGCLCAVTDPNGAGAAYVFRLTNAEATQQQKLTPPPPPPNAPGSDLFGETVAVNDDRVLVGAPWASTLQLSGSGIAYSYTSGGLNTDRPQWLDAPNDGTRFDVRPGASTEFTVTAADPAGGHVTITTSFFGTDRKPRTQPAYIDCVSEVAPAGAASDRCTIAPGNQGLALMVVDAVTDGGVTAGSREYLVGGSAYHYVSLGDSYSAGEGIPPYFRDGYNDNVGAQDWQTDNRCHRSSLAYNVALTPSAYSQPVYVLASGGGDPGSGDGFNKYGSEHNVRESGNVGWASWACSGAKTVNVLPITRGGAPQLDFKSGHLDQYTQLDNASVNFATDLVTVTIGGNDVGFSDVLAYCAVADCTDPAYEASVNTNIDNLQPTLMSVYHEIRLKTFNARTLAVGYPYLLPKTPVEQSCAKLSPFSQAEQNFLRAATDRLDSVISSAAAAAGVEFVDVRNEFAGHEVCGALGEWINGVTSPDGFTIHPGDGSFHPNVKGQLCGYGRAVNLAVGRPDWGLSSCLS